MPIVVNNPRTVPELVYENVLILDFKVSQELSQEQIFKVEYEYILYAIVTDENGEEKKIFDNKSRTKDVIDNFEETIAGLVDASDISDLTQTVINIETAIATLIKVRQDIEGQVI